MTARRLRMLVAPGIAAVVVAAFGPNAFAQCSPDPSITCFDLGTLGETSGPRLINESGQVLAQATSLMSLDPIEYRVFIGTSIRGPRPGAPCGGAGRRHRRPGEGGSRPPATRQDSGMTTSSAQGPTTRESGGMPIARSCTSWGIPMRPVNGSAGHMHTRSTFPRVSCRMTEFMPIGR